MDIRRPNLLVGLHFLKEKKSLITFYYLSSVITIVNLCDAHSTVGDLKLVHSNYV